MDATWSRVDDEFYVASIPGAFLGCVEVDSDGGFSARDPYSRALGTYPTREAAMAAVVDFSTNGQNA